MENLNKLFDEITQELTSEGQLFEVREYINKKRKENKSLGRPPTPKKPKKIKIMPGEQKIRKTNQNNIKH